jgi:hypothetical protein
MRMLRKACKAYGSLGQTVLRKVFKAEKNILRFLKKEMGRKGEMRK